MAFACLGEPTEAEFDEAITFIYNLLHYTLGSLGKDWNATEKEILADIQERVMERRPLSLTTMTLGIGDTVLELRENYKEQLNSFIQNHGKDIFTDDEHFNDFLERFCGTNFQYAFVEDFLKYCIFILQLSIHCYDSGQECYVDNILWFTGPLFKMLLVKGVRFDAQRFCHDLDGYYVVLKFCKHVSKRRNDLSQECHPDLFNCDECF